MEPDRVNHVALYPNTVTFPRSRELWPNIDLAVKGHDRVRSGRAQTNNGAKVRARGDFWTQYNHASWFDHFGLFKSAVEIADQNRTGTWVFLDGHITDLWTDRV
jgi:hypothetical protein